MIDKDPARTLTDVALTELREAILSGELPAGSPVRLQDQAERLSMSSVPIREALRFLERSGLIERTPHRGSFVAGMSTQDLEDIYAIRLELEVMAIRLAVRRMTDEGRAQLAELLERYVEAATTNSPAAWDRHAQLHMSLYRLSGSKWLLLLLPMLWDSTERYRRLLLQMDDTTEHWISEHRTIVTSCVDGNESGAVEALRSHLQHTYEVAIARLRGDEWQAASNPADG